MNPKSMLIFVLLLLIGIFIGMICGCVGLRTDAEFIFGTRKCKPKMILIIAECV